MSSDVMFFQGNSGVVYSENNEYNLAQLRSLPGVIPQPSLLYLASYNNDTSDKFLNRPIEHSKVDISLQLDQGKYHASINKPSKIRPICFNGSIKKCANKSNKKLQNSILVLKSHRDISQINNMGLKLLLPANNERSLLSQPFINISNQSVNQKTANILSYLKPVIVSKPAYTDSSLPLYITYIPNSSSNSNSSPLILSYMPKSQPNALPTKLTQINKINHRENKNITNISDVRLKKSHDQTLSFRNNLLKKSLLFSDDTSNDANDEPTWNLGLLEEYANINSKIGNTISSQNYDLNLPTIKTNSEMDLDHNHVLNMCAELKSIFSKTFPIKGEAVNKPLDIRDVLKKEQPTLVTKVLDKPGVVTLDLLYRNYDIECQKKPCIFASTLQQTSGERNIIKHCSRFAIPYSNFCSIHIAAHPSQKLFERCSAKFSNNIQCTKPAFDPINDVPLCWQHSRKKAHHDKALEKTQKSSKRPTRLSQTLLVVENGETVLRDVDVIMPPPPSKPAATIKVVKGSSSPLVGSHNLNNNYTNKYQHNKYSPSNNPISNSEPPTYSALSNYSLFCSTNNTISPNKTSALQTKICRLMNDESFIVHNKICDRGAINVASHLVQPQPSQGLVVPKKSRRRNPVPRKGAYPSTNILNGNMSKNTNHTKRNKTSFANEPSPNINNGHIDDIEHFSATILDEMPKILSSKPDCDTSVCSGSERVKHQRKPYNLYGNNNMSSNRCKPPPSMVGMNDPFLSGANMNANFIKKNGYVSGYYTGNKRTTPLFVSPIGNINGDNSHNSNDMLYNFSTDLLEKSFDESLAATNHIDDSEIKDVISKFPEGPYNEYFQDIGAQGSNKDVGGGVGTEGMMVVYPSKEDDIMMQEALADMSKDFSPFVSDDAESRIIKEIQDSLMKDFKPRAPSSSLATNMALGQLPRTNIDHRGNDNSMFINCGYNHTIKVESDKVALPLGNSSSVTAIKLLHQSPSNLEECHVQQQYTQYPNPLHNYYGYDVGYDSSLSYDEAPFQHSDKVIYLNQHLSSRSASMPCISKDPFLNHCMMTEAGYPVVGHTQFIHDEVRGMNGAAHQKLHGNTLPPVEDLLAPKPSQAFFFNVKSENID